MGRYFYKVSLFGILCLLLMNSCSQDFPIDFEGEYTEDTSKNKEAKLNIRTSHEQVLLYANLFSDQADDAGTPEELRNMREPRQVAYVSYYVEGQDTLLYAVNYQNNSGFMIVSGDNSSFPIIAHSDEGNLNFSDIDKGSPLQLEVQRYAEMAKRNIHNPRVGETEYFKKWKDLGNEDFQYEVIANNDAPTSDLRAYRRYSTNKEAIFPSTGKRLDKWCQKGTFNDFAPNKVVIGCPAVAIGMLLFDCLNRDGGKYELTTPTMPFTASYAEPTNSFGTEVSEVLKEIADSIPNYSWARPNSDEESGADPDDIVLGLRKIGFKEAKVVDYDFQTLYENLSFTSQDMKYSRGVLIGGMRINPYEWGHIWFCDGYYEKSYTVIKRNHRGTEIERWKEYDDRLYMNWGFGSGNGNGWYSVADSKNTWIAANGGFKDYKRIPKMIIGLHNYQGRTY